MNIRILQLKILFELNQFNASILAKEEVDIPAVIERFRKSIAFEKKNRRQLSYHADHYRQFERCYKKLFKLQELANIRYKIKNDQKYIKKRNQLRQEIEETLPPSWSWFLEKLADL